MPFNPKRPKTQDQNFEGTVHANGDLVIDGWSTFNSRISMKRTVVPYSGTVSIDAWLANEYDITASDTNAFTIANPVNADADGQRITITIRNTSNSTLGTVTWGTLYKLAAWTSPNPGFSRSIDFRYDGTNWVEVSRTPSDVPN